MLPLSFTNSEENVWPKKLIGKPMAVGPLEPSSLGGRIKLLNPVRIAPPDPLGPGVGTVNGKTLPVEETVPVTSDSVIEGTDKLGNNCVNDIDRANELSTGPIICVL